MQQPDIPRAGSATPSPTRRRLPAWLLVLIGLASVPVVLVAGVKLTLVAIEADHYAFVRAVHLGQTRAGIDARFGKPVETFTPDQRQELAGLLGPDETYRSSVYYHSYRVIRGQRPAQFATVSVWHTGIARGEFVFFDARGNAICILSGSS